MVEVGSVIVFQEDFKLKQFGPEKYRDLVSKSSKFGGALFLRKTQYGGTAC